MKRVYECDLSKIAQLTKILEAEKFAPDSFERIGYKLREGSSLMEDRSKIYIYISSSEENVKKADARMKEIANAISTEKEEKIIYRIVSEDENAESGFGSLFGN